MTATETRLKAQFAAMESSLLQIQTQSSWLSRSARAALGRLNSAQDGAIRADHRSIPFVSLDPRFR